MVDKIKICYQRYKLEFLPTVLNENNHELYGQITYAKETIRIATGENYQYSKALQNEAILHEILHGICFQRQLKLKEREIEALAVGMYEMMLDNPELVKELSEVGDGS